MGPGLSRAVPGGRRPRALRLVALFEALEGTVVLLSASGLLSLLHRDVPALAAALVAHTHLNPASRYPRIFLDAAAQLHDGRLQLLAAGAALYAAVRLAEAWGLYRDRAWAEWLAAGSGAVYVPFEVLELARHPSLHGTVLLLLNLAVVAVMLQALRARRRRARASTAAATATATATMAADTPGTPP